MQYGTVPRNRLQYVIVVTGVSGSGKSTVGKRLAAALGATFMEGDDYHTPASVAKMRAGIPLDDRDRWPWLGKIGEAIGAHARQGRSVVAACSALKRTYRARLEETARRPLIFVALSVDPALLEHRLRARRHHFMPPSLLESQLADWEPLTSRERGTAIAAAGSAMQTVVSIERWLRLCAQRGFCARGVRARGVFEQGAFTKKAGNAGPFR
jgi:gluconokinase